MKPIDKTLSWAQRLQTTCFGTPISVQIEVSKGVKYGKLFSVTTFVENRSQRYMFDSTTSDEELYQTWGVLKNDVNKLLDEYVGLKVNKHGRVTE